ncbi:MAG: hypothetical protein H6738_23000 [Alphaproteobacteria bacterium]|nr:hypothetical protein [Alphaproteobacteria bacterium]MCB9699672.1 hypothetical protein [Alphaproteobacteria bacterium]
MSDQRFTLEAIRPLVSQCNPTGRHLVVTFTCPVTRRHVNARWSAPQRNDVASRVAASAKQSMWYEMRRQAHSMLATALGHGMMGRVASQTMDAAMYAASPGNSYSTASAARNLSQGEVDQGVVEAFQSVASQFAWAGNRWVHSSAAQQVLSPLDAQLQQHPLVTRYDRLLAARMLYEVAASHGGVSPEERSHLEDVIDPELGSIQALAQRPPLSRAELAEASPGGVRVSLLALAWTLALVDESFDEGERRKLAELTQGLGVPQGEADRARDLARSWILDQAFERAFGWGGHDVTAREMAVDLGRRIGMSREEVEIAEARFQRRRG